MSKTIKYPYIDPEYGIDRSIKNITFNLKVINEIIENIENRIK